MGEITRFPLEMQPARPYPGYRDPREQEVRDPYPVTPDTVALAEVSQSMQRSAAGYVPPTNDDWKRLEAHEALYAIVKEYGADRVQRWVRSLATIQGF